MSEALNEWTIAVCDQRHRACAEKRLPLVRLPARIRSSDDDAGTARASSRNQSRERAGRAGDEGEAVSLTLEDTVAKVVLHRGSEILRAAGAAFV